MPAEIVNLLYLAAAMLFIAGLKDLTHPRSAPRGNRLGAAGMLLAVITALASEMHLHWGYIILGLAVGSVAGVWIAMKVRMTGMPQLVALLNGLGGGASLAVAATALIQATAAAQNLTPRLTISSAVSAVVGAITFWGSLVAFAKLQGLMRKALIFRGQQVLNALLLLSVAICGFLMIRSTDSLGWLGAMVVLASLSGILLVSPIGGADMPVVIAALNSYSGLAASATGFVLANNVLIISGSLVGASGMILTRVMCKAMNRSFAHVILGVPMGRLGFPSQDEVYAGKIKSTSAEEAAMVLEAARRVIIVPGYGMAVSQGQYAVRDLANLLESKGITVEFAIHPVAGRMPGHMNVLLAEADIDYEKLKDMEAINPTFEEADVALIIGANDVVNPEARLNSKSPIAGMPILNADKAKSVIVIKRGLSPGFAGIPNPLFAAEHAMMLFKDGKQGINEINAALKDG